MSNKSTPAVGRKVEFSANLKPAAALRVEVPRHEGDKEGEVLTARGGLMVLKILQMPIEERVNILRDAAQDPLVTWFAMLTSAERIAIVSAAEDNIREMVAKNG